MRGATKAFLVLLAALAAAKRKPSPSPRVAQLNFQWVEFASCPETPEMNLTTELKMSREGDVYADIEWIGFKGAKTISLVRMIVWSCKEDGTGCEHFIQWDPPLSGCDFVKAKNVVWSPAFQNIKPSFECPISTAPRFTNKNITLDKNALNSMPLPRKHLYKVRLEIWNENEELFWCDIMSFIHKLYKPRN